MLPHWLKSLGFAFSFLHTPFTLLNLPPTPFQTPQRPLNPTAPQTKQHPTPQATIYYGVGFHAHATQNSAKIEDLIRRLI